MHKNKNNKNFSLSPPNPFYFWRELVKMTVRHCNEIKHTIKYHPVHGKSQCSSKRVHLQQHGLTLLAYR